jgi:sulfide:quinone oxidoreductase
VMFPLAPVYRRAGIEFKQALAVALHPEGSAANPRAHVTSSGPSPEKRPRKSKFLMTFSSMQRDQS